MTILTDGHEHESFPNITTMTDFGFDYRRRPGWEKCYLSGLVLLITMASGFPIFVNEKPVSTFIFLYTIAGLCYFKPDLRWAFRAIILFATLMLLQTFYYGGFYVKTAILQLMLFSTAAFSVALVGYSFIYIYIRIIYILAIIAIVLFVPILISPGFHDMLLSISPIVVEKIKSTDVWDATSRNILLLHFPPDFYEGLIRNSGPFWEPAAFGGNLMLAIMFNTLSSGKIINKMNTIFFIAVITTFSTTTYLALGVFISGYAIIRTQDKLMKGLIVLMMAMAMAGCLTQLDFLGKKIIAEFEEAEYAAFMEGGDTRVASAMLDLREISQSAWEVCFGMGTHPDVRVKTADKEVVRSNGITDLLVDFGLVFFLITFILLARTWLRLARMSRVETSLGVLAFITVILLSFSEIYFIYLLFKTLTLLGLLNYRLLKLQKFPSIRPTILSRERPDTKEVRPTLSIPGA